MKRGINRKQYVKEFTSVLMGKDSPPPTKYQTVMHRPELTKHVSKTMSRDPRSCPFLQKETLKYTHIAPDSYQKNDSTFGQKKGSYFGTKAARTIDVRLFA